MIFAVHTLPATQGSKTIGRTKSGRRYMRESSKRTKPFRKAVAAAAVAAGVRTTDGAVGVCVNWTMPRPPSHFTRSGSLVKGAPAKPGKYDQDKVLRAVCDALAGIAYRNDRQVRAVACDCRYSPETIVLIELFDATKEGRWMYV